MNYAQESRPYVRRRAREIAGEFVRYELPELMAELRRIYYSRIARAAKYYKQPEPTPVPKGGRPPLTFTASSVSLVTVDGDGWRNEMCY
jgi:hypothetical protein